MGIQTYSEARAYLEELIKPIPYKKVEDTLTSYNPLDRMRTLLALFNNPEKKFTSVQVSGTSGKGSTAYLLSHMLTAAGYKTGFTLSPHLLSITERFQINEQNIPEKVFISLVNELVPVVMKMKKMEVGEPTYFEALMALTFLHFAHEQVDIAVIEVGLEGRFDGTNTLDPLVFILTNISLDHVEFLGDTEEKIAREAIGAVEGKVQTSSLKLLEKNVPVVITGVTQPSVQQIVRDVCDNETLRVRMLGHEFLYRVKKVTDGEVIFDFRSDEVHMDDLSLSLTGEYQASNATLALEAVCALKEYGFSVSDEIVRNALKTAHFSGRFEKNNYTLNANTYTLILDGAHNPAKIDAFVRSLQKIYPQEKYIVIFGCKKHKDITQMLTILAPVVDTLIVTRYYTTTDAAKNSSMTVSDVLSQVAETEVFNHVLSAETIHDAFVIATETCKQNNMKIIVTGSLYLVGEMKQELIEQV